MSQNKFTSWFLNWIKDPFKAIFFIVLIGYLFLYTPFGLENGDMGSIFGISWSMYNGYIPHVDFYYIKPAFPPYFHSLFLYLSEDFAYLINRGFYYVQVFTFAWLTVDLLKNHFKSINANTQYFLATLAAIITIHNYPPMPWNTIDGVFFTVIGIYILLKKENWYWIALATLCISLGVLSKQSFYFMPVFITAYLIWNKAYIKLGTFIAFGVVFAFSSIGILFALGAWEPFIEQTFSFTSGGSFIEAGFKNYLRSAYENWTWLLLTLVLLWAARHKDMSPNSGLTVVFVLIAGALLNFYLKEDSYHTVKAFMFQLWFLLAIGYVFWTAIKSKEQKYRLLLLLLCLSWCASISNGFKTPISYAVPLVISLYVYLQENRSEIVYKWASLAVLAAFLGVFYVGYQTVYNDSERGELTYNMGDIFTRLRGIKSDEATYKQYEQLKALDAKYDNYTILPSMTLGHYVTNTKNPIGVDWVFNHHLADDIDAHIKMLEDQDVTVFLEPFENHKNSYEESSLLTVYIKENWQQIDHTPYFRVYKKPDNK
ncbi:MAG: hypothetical protein ABJM06_01385 [Gilvibacter sp.]